MMLDQDYFGRHLKTEIKTEKENGCGGKERGKKEGKEGEREGEREGRKEGRWRKNRNRESHMRVLMAQNNEGTCRWPLEWSSPCHYQLPLRKVIRLGSSTPSAKF
jgi:hypothetical protein